MIERKCTPFLILFLKKKHLFSFLSNVILLRAKEEVYIYYKWLDIVNKALEINNSFLLSLTHRNDEAIRTGEPKTNRLRNGFFFFGKI